VDDFNHDYELLLLLGCGQKCIKMAETSRRWALASYLLSHPRELAIHDTLDKTLRSITLSCSSHSK